MTLSCAPTGMTPRPLPAITYPDVSLSQDVWQLTLYVLWRLVSTLPLALELPVVTLANGTLTATMTVTAAASGRLSLRLSAAVCQRAHRLLAVAAASEWHCLRDCKPRREVAG